MPRALSLQVRISLAVISIFLITPTASAQSFSGLGDLPGGAFHSEALGVSEDGSVVVGVGNSEESGRGVEAFRWSAADGMQGLGDLPGGAFHSVANAVSADGTVVVGYSLTQTYGGYIPFRWTAEDGLKELGVPDSTGAYLQGEANDISADGTVIIGYDYIDFWKRIIRWVDGKREDLGFLDNVLAGGGPITAFGVSADGAIVVGAAPSANAVYHPNDWEIQYWKEAFIWTTEDGMVGLGDLPGGRFHSEAHDVSDDGSVVVGIGSEENGNNLFRWTAEGGIETLGARLGTVNTAAVSADGTVIVGGGDRFNGRAVIWTETTGLRLLKDVLETDYGLDLADWTLTAASDISADGNVIVGSGINPDGNNEAWRAVLSSGTSAETGARATDFTLSSAYPNPAHDAATLRLTLDAPRPVTAAAYDMLGRRVAVLHDGPLAQGEHKLRLDAAALVAGVYVVRVATRSATISRRVVIIR